MKALVTGSGGYIGTALCERLLELGIDVVGVDRYFFGRDLLGPELLEHPNFRLVEADIRSLDSSLFEGIDVVMDLAGLSNDPSCDLDAELTTAINFKGSVNVATCAKQAGVRQYIFSSSCSVYGHGSTESLRETSPLNPISAYAHAKISAEQTIRPLADQGFTVTMLRNSTVYGMSRRMRFDLVVNIMTLNAWRDGEIFVMGGGLQWRPLVHVQDVCSAFLRVMDSDHDRVQGHVYNVGSNDQNLQVRDIARMVHEVMPDTQVTAKPGDPDTRTYNVAFDKIEAELGYKALRTPIHGVMEILAGLEDGVLDGDDPRTNTVRYYQQIGVS